MNVSRIEREGMSLPSHASATLRISTQKAGARRTQPKKLKKEQPDHGAQGWKALRCDRA
jgi:hypothetical protein